jgi:hypothetical protein
VVGVRASVYYDAVMMDVRAEMLARLGHKSTIERTHGRASRQQVPSISVRIIEHAGRGLASRISYLWTANCSAASRSLGRKRVTRSCLLALLVATPILSAISAFPVRERMGTAIARRPISSI